jgi:hypothetical protein
MSVIDRLRQARNGEEIAREVEPLAQAMAALSDELKGTLEELRTAATSVRGTLESGSTKLNTCTQTATTQAQNIEKLFRSLLDEQRKASQRFSLTMWGLAILASLVGGAGAGIGLWVWQKPSQPIKEKAKHWNEVSMTYNNLDPAKKRQFRELMGWAEPEGEAKPRTGRPKR